MSKRTSTTVKARNENSVILRTVIIAAVILAGIFVVLYFIEDNLVQLFGNLTSKLLIGLMLFSLWLTVGSTVRSINRIERSTASWKLILAGVLTAAVGAALFSSFLAVFPKVSKSANAFEVAGASGGMILVMSGIAFVAALLAVINTRVRSKFLGNMLEIIIIAAVIGGFLYIATQ